jgi:hypothetical protein
MYLRDVKKTLCMVKPQQQRAFPKQGAQNEVIAESGLTIWECGDGLNPFLKHKTKVIMNLY